jgi:hypothetical protein
MPWMIGILIAVLASAPATAYDLAAAARVFAAAQEKLPKSAPVLGGWCGNDSKVAAFSIERIMDRAAWSAAWARHAPGENAPKVDFSTAMVIAIFTGAVRISVIPSISLDGVTEDDKIEIATMNFVNDVIRQEQENLYLFVVLRRSAKAVRVLARSYGLMRTPREQIDVLKEFEALSQPK